MALYPEYDLVRNFVDTSKELLNTGRSMRDLFQFFTSKYDTATAAIYMNERGKLSSYRYSDLKSHAFGNASRLAKFLVAIPKHKPIALKLANSPHWGEYFWAILMCGYKPLLIDAKMNVEGVNNLVAQTKAIAVLTDDDNQYEVMKLDVREISEQKIDYRYTERWENEVIFCSSGTTGDIHLMIYNGEALCKQINAASCMPDTSKDIIYPDKMGQTRILAMIPFHHIFGFIAVFLWYSFYGKIIVYVPSLAPNTIMSICQKVKITHVYSVPLFWDNLAQAAIRSADLGGPKTAATLNRMIGYNTGHISKSEAGQSAYNFTIKYIQGTILGSDVRFCISGGGYISEKTLNTINGLGYPLYNGYGMTELGVTSVELTPTVAQRLKGSIGKPLTGVEYKIIPTGKNKNLGELVVKNDFVHIREIIGGVETPTQLDENGYFHTGDVAEVDAAGSYYIRGRLKEVIINANGDNVYPEEVEATFKSIKGITNECVLGLKQKGTLDEKIVLVLEIDNTVTDDEFEKIKTEVRDVNMTLPLYKRVQEILVYRDKLPLANSMKVKRYIVRQMIENKDRGFINLDRKQEEISFDGFDDKLVNEVTEEMRSLFSSVLILPKYKLTDNGHWINDFGGDSMSYIELVTQVEAQYNVQIPEEMYGKLTSINDFVREVLALKQK